MTNKFKPKNLFTSPGQTLFYYLFQHTFNNSLLKWEKTLTPQARALYETAARQLLNYYQNKIPNTTQPYNPHNNETITTTFAERLQIALKLTNVSQATLSRRLRLHESTISNFCSNHRTPKLQNIQRILLALPAIDPKWLITGQTQHLTEHTQPTKYFTESFKYD